MPAGALSGAFSKEVIQVDILKTIEEQPERQVMVTCDIQKVDEEQRRVFGFFSIVEDEHGLVVDKQGDVILPVELEKAAYDFVKNSRIAGEMHTKQPVGVLIESVVMTREKQQSWGIDLKKVFWWGGMEIHNDEVWEKVKKGIYKSFSIGGRGRGVYAEVEVEVEE
jgi:hypothetical protein